MGRKFSDEQLLDGLTKDKYYTIAEIAEISGIPSPTIYRRLNWLIERGALIEGTPRPNNTGEGGRPNRTFTPRNARRGPVFEENSSLRYHDRVWTIEEYEHLTRTLQGRVLGILITMEGQNQSAGIWDAALPQIKAVIRKRINEERASIMRWEAILYSPELNPQNAYEVEEQRNRIRIWAQGLTASGAIESWEEEWSRLDPENL